MSVEGLRNKWARSADGLLIRADECAPDVDYRCPMEDCGSVARSEAEAAERRRVNAVANGDLVQERERIVAALNAAASGKFAGIRAMGGTPLDPRCGAQSEGGGS